MKRFSLIPLFAFGILLPDQVLSAEASSLVLSLSTTNSPESIQPTLFVKHAAKVASSAEITILLSSGVLIAITLLIYVLYRNNVLTKKFHQLKKELYGESPKPAKLEN